MADKEDATQEEGVSEEEKTTAEIEEEQRKNPQLSRRMEMIDLISENVETARVKDEQGEVEEEPEKTLAEKATEEEVEEEEETVSLKIDGSMQAVPVSKVLDMGKRALQKELASDKRLEEATKILNEAKEIVAKNNRLPSKEDDEEINTQTRDAPVSDDMRSLAKAIQYGEEDEAAEALEKLVKLRVSQEVPDVSKEVDKVLFEREVRATILKPEKEGGFKELWDVPMIQREIIDRTNKALAAGEDNTVDLYTRIAGEVRDDISKLMGPTKSEKRSVNVEERRERKLKNESINSASATLKTDKEPEPEKDASSIIADIKARRGQR